MVHASLFSGIGGFDLAALWAGWSNQFNCEIDPFCRKVLKYHFPNTIQHENIKETSFTVYKGRVDVLSGGFPCQPFSLAGSRKGTDDDRYLWPEFLRAIREIRPSWVIGENVAGITSMVEPGEVIQMERKTLNDGEEHLRQKFVIETICGDLEKEGYSIWPVIIPACAVGAPHKRDRVWFIANSDNAGFQTQGAKQPSTRAGQYGKLDRTTSNSNYKRLTEQYFPEKPNEQKFFSRFYYENRTDWQNFPTESPVCNRNDGISGRLDSITFSKWRIESIKAGGNAIVPQVAYEIFSCINIINKFYGL